MDANGHPNMLHLYTGTVLNLSEAVVYDMVYIVYEYIGYEYIVYEYVGCRYIDHQFSIFTNAAESIKKIYTS
jgi:hypothetical protein